MNILHFNRQFKISVRLLNYQINMGLGESYTTDPTFFLLFIGKRFLHCNHDYLFQLYIQLSVVYMSYEHLLRYKELVFIKTAKRC